MRHALTLTRDGAACYVCLARFAHSGSRAAEGPCGGAPLALARVLRERNGHVIHAVGYDNLPRVAGLRGADGASPEDLDAHARILF